MHCNTSKCMQKEFEPKLPRDILKLSKNKTFDVKARFGTIYSGSKTEKYLLKNSTIGNRLLFSELSNHLNLLVLKIQTGVSFFLIVIYF